MELEDLEVLFKVNTEQMQPTLDKIKSAFSNMTGKVADDTKSDMKKVESSFDLSAGLKKVQEQIKQLNETVASSFNKMADNSEKGAAKVSQSTSKMFSGAKQQVSKDLQSVLAEINSKMQQARAAQAKMNDLMNQKNSLSTAQQSGTQGIKFDSQIATAQAQMTRYQNQAKALAQAMRGEFNAVPDSLNRISRAMDQNEVKIETYRNTLTRLNAQLKDMQDTPSSMQNDKWANSYAKVEKAVMSTQEKMNKLINSNDELVKSYAYVQDRGESLSGIVGKLNTELSEDSSNARKAATSMNEMSSSMSHASMNMNGMNNGGGIFNKIKSAITGAGNSMKMFGSDTSHSMDMSTTSTRRMSGALDQIRMQISFLPSMIIVYGLLYNGITQLSQGFLSALKTNSQFSSSLNQIQVNLLTAFYPIYTAVLPAINAMMSALAKVTSYTAQFTAALFGMSNSAAKSGASNLYSQVKAMNDTSSSSSAAAKAVKEANKQITASNKANREAVAAANKQITASNKAATASYEEQKKAAEELSDSLMGFDELNILDKNQSNDLTKPEAQAKETYTPQSLQSTDSDDDSDGDDGLNFNTPTTQFAGLQDAVNNLKKILGEIFDPMKEAWDAKGKEVVDAAKYAWQEVKRALEDVGRSFLHVWDNGTGEKTMELLLQLLADMLNIIGDIAKAFAEAWEKGDAGTKLIQTIFNSLNDVLGLIHDIATSFRKAFNDNNLGEQIFSNLIKLATTLADMIGDFAKAFDAAWKKGNAGTDLFKAILNAANQVLVLLNKIATSFRDAFNDGTGEKIFSNILGIATDVFKIIGNFVGQFDKAWQHGNTGTSIFKTILGMVNDMLSALKDMADYTVTWSKKLDFTPLLQSIDDLLSAIRPVVKEDIWDGLDWGYKNILLPLAKFTITELVPNFINDLAAAFKLVGSIINVAKPAFQWIWDSFFEPIAKWTGGVIVDVMKKLASIMSGLADVIDKHKTAFELVAKAIVTMLTIKLVAGGLDKGVGLIGTLADNAVILGGKGNVLKDFFGKITGLSDLKNAVTNVKSLAELSWTGIKSGAGYVVDLVVGLKNWSIWSKLAAAGQAALNLVMDANPIALIVLAIAAVVLGLVELYKHNKKFRDFCNGIWTAITTWFGDTIKWLKKNWVDIAAFIINPVAGITTWFLKDTSVGKSIVKWASSLPGKAADWAKSVGSKIGTHIDNAKKDIADAGEKVGTWFNNFRTGASTTISSWASSAGKFIQNGVGGAKSLAQKAGSTIGGWVNDFRDGAGRTLSGWASGLGSVAHNGISGAKSLAQKAGSTLGGWVSDFRSGTGKQIADWAGGLGGKIGSGLSSGWKAVKNGAADIANAIVGTIGKAVNGVIDGIKWILNHVGASKMAKSMNHWSVPQFARGTSYHKGGPAIVNDQSGDKYREAYKLPDGRTGIFPAVRNMMVNLPRGTQILNATQTARKATAMIPHYASGIGDFDFSGLNDLFSNMNFDFGSLNFDFGGMNFDFGNLFSGLGSSLSDIWTGVKSTAEDMWDDFTHPEKVLKAAMSKFVSFTGLSGYPLNVAEGIKDFSVDQAKDFIGNILKQFGVGVQTGPGAAGWTSAVKKALAKLSLPTTDAYVNAWVKQIQTESGGNEKAMGGNDGLSDGNAEGLLQVKPPTFAANHIAGFNDIWKGYDNILAGINYAKNRYGVSGMLKVIGHGHGYENGGMGSQEGLYPLFEGNKPEMVLPLTDIPRSMQLIKQALQFMGTTFSGGLQMPSSLTSATDLTNISSASSSNSASQSSVGGINELGTTIVNALLQGLQMAGTTNNSSGATQPIDVHVDVKVADLDFGNAAVKSINAVNQKNGRNMLNI
ncbi:phage tail protein [Liquorilactobacillus mali]|uniref:phage tail protein n=1 Tax=Liquorilactobacillus mali TaxID=1618 RepID=UPI00264DF2FC|nr:phage tail protein [Liquorilactobacillus mali]MDN7144448.1 phage tail protein [Liquorilactobacillus mali]